MYFDPYKHGDNAEPAVASETADDGYITRSNDKSVLGRFREMGRALIYTRNLAVNVRHFVARLLKPENREFLEALDGNFYRISFEDGGIKLTYSDKSEKQSSRLDGGRQPISLIDIFATVDKAEAAALAQDIEERILEARDLFGHDKKLEIAFRTLTSFKQVFHEDEEFDVLGASYTNLGTEFGPKEAFLAKSNVSNAYTLKDKKALRQTKTGDVGILNVPHRSALTKGNARTAAPRFWIGIHCLKR